LGLVGDDNETVTVGYALVNRYAVDRVSADIMLGFFFPGAVMDTAEGNPPRTSAGVAAPAAAAAAETGTAPVPEAASSAGPT
jgi:hypothetical protein